MFSQHMTLNQQLRPQGQQEHACARMACVHVPSSADHDAYIHVLSSTSRLCVYVCVLVRASMCVFARAHAYVDTAASPAKKNS